MKSSPRATPPKAWRRIEGVCENLLNPTTTPSRPASPRFGYNVGHLVLLALALGANNGGLYHD